MYLPPGAYPDPPDRHDVRNAAIRKYDAIASVIPKGSTVIDIGVGIGMGVELLRERGFVAEGIDGIPNIEEHTKGLVRWYDLTSRYVQISRVADWGLFLEVGEHIPEEYEDLVFRNVAAIPKSGLIVSWAEQHQGGVGTKKHVNCLSQVYVASQFAKQNWFVDETDTMFLRQHVSGRVLLKERIMVLKRGGLNAKIS